MKVALVGATGAVGGEILGILGSRSFSLDELIPVASRRSAGRRIAWQGRSLEVKALEEGLFAEVDLALFDVPDDVSREWAPVAVSKGAIVIDNSAAWRMDADVPLVVPEINPEDALNRPKGIIASPNCTTLAMVVPIAALHRAFGLRRLILSSYQAASGSGKVGVDELWDQTARHMKQPEAVRAGLARDVLERGDVFTHPLAMNVVPQCGSFKTDGFTSEELKLRDETRKIMSLPELKVTATCVRVPVVSGHGVAVHAEFSREVTPEEARDILREAPGVVLQDDPSKDSFPTPLQAAGLDPCYVGRVRQDPEDRSALQLFCVADNLRKGAALNTVQVAELLT